MGNMSENLQESRTSELEIVEFSVKDAIYGINVAKVKEIIKASCDLVPVPDSHPSIVGAINLRGAIIPVVDLAKHLKLAVAFNAKLNRIVITEFNGIVLGFLVTAVSRIHRISWKSVEVPSQMLQTDQGYTVGIVRVKEQVIFLLDFEKIAAHINPAVHMQEPHGGEYAGSPVNRASKTIFVVDDSDLSRKLIEGHLRQAGYQTASAINGEEAWTCLSALTERPDFDTIESFYHMVVTDIEMPRMDGLHLIQKIKESPQLRRLPCIAFSSIISKEIINQCRRFGADGEISKPEIGRLVALVDARAL